ncbi:hypothetical protein A9Q76_04230 [Arcobacter sp. 31_11_sub10_T18]|nr:hypothetical protein A9Q76_04230 [Arcobacter sp. 31_11_sub10_T18]
MKFYEKLEGEKLVILENNEILDNAINNNFISITLFSQEKLSYQEKKYLCSWRNPIICNFKLSNIIIIAVILE